MRWLPEAALALVDTVMAAYAASDVEAATALIRKIALEGREASAFAAPERRAEAQALRREIYARMQTLFAEWVQRHEAPDVEVDRALSMFQANAMKWTAETAAALKPAEDGPATVVRLIVEQAARNPAFDQDVIMRDIGWAMVKAALAAGAERQGALKLLGLALPDQA